MTITALLATAAVFFPFWMNIWQERPFQEQDLNYDGKTFMTVETYDLLLNNLSTADARLRDQVYTQLASKPVPANQEVLLHCLKIEKETRQQGTILRLLQQTAPETIPASAIEPYLQRQQPAQVTEAAIMLYGKLPQADAKKLRPLLGQPTANTLPYILRKRAWEAFAASQRLADALGNEVFDFQEADEAIFQALALQTALRQTTRRTSANPWIDAALAGAPLLRLAVANDPQPKSHKVMQQLLQDASPAVRIAFCKAHQGGSLPMILLALQDKDEMVQYEAIQALGRFPQLDDTALTKLIDCLNSTVLQIRDGAEETLLHHARNEHRQEILALIDERLAAAPSTAFAYHACRLIKQLKHVGGVPAAVKILESTNDAAAISAALDVLAALAPINAHGELILRQARHSSALVRQSAALALGHLNIIGSEPTLKSLSLDQHSPEVRTAAFAAMGYFPQATFTADILACLKNTTKTTEAERVSAAWAAGKIKPTTANETAALLPLAKRLLEQVTLPVVPGDMEPAFDGLPVIANAIYSITVMGKTLNSPPITEIADIVLGIYDVPADQLESLSRAQSNMQAIPTQEIPRCPITCSLANQARQWQKNEAITTQEVPEGSIFFPMREAK